MDETTLSPDPVLRACWIKKGQQRRIPATRAGRKKNWHHFGGYNWLKDRISWGTAAIKNTTTFIEFLEELLIRQYPTERVVLVDG